jgi:hypothetical protein
MLHKIILFFISVLLQVINVKAQKTKSSYDKNTQQSSANLKLQKKLDSIFSSFNNSTPGVAITVLQNGKVIAKKAYSMAGNDETALIMTK